MRLPGRVLFWSKEAETAFVKQMKRVQYINSVGAGGSAEVYWDNSAASGTPIRQPREWASFENMHFKPFGDKGVSAPVVSKKSEQF